MYERAGVKEYFTVNPDDSEIHSWLLTKNKYELQYAATGKFKSSVLALEFDF